VFASIGSSTGEAGRAASRSGRGTSLGGFNAGLVFDEGAVTTEAVNSAPLTSIPAPTPTSRLFTRPTVPMPTTDAALAVELNAMSVAETPRLAATRFMASGDARSASAERRTETSSSLRARVFRGTRSFT
jgi:hypothetical protein